MLGYPKGLKGITEIMGCGGCTLDQINDHIKLCSRCHLEKNLTEFNKCKAGKRGHKSICRTCQKIIGKDYYNLHREETKIRLSKWRKSNPAKAAMQSLRYNTAHKIERNKYAKERRLLNHEKAIIDDRRKYQENAEKCKEKSRQWRKNNRTAIKESLNRWRKANPQQHREEVKRRKIKKRNVAIEKFANIEIFERDKWICQLCKRPINKRLIYPDVFSPSIDHITPLAHGGTHERKNVQAAHLMCNVKAGMGGIKQLRLFG
jgi:hypothetical protein